MRVHSTGVKPALRKRAADDLGQRREYRVLQFREHQADQPGPLAAQLRGPLVAEHVEGGQHGFAGRVRDARPAVEDPADGRLGPPTFAATSASRRVGVRIMPQG